MLFEKDGPKLPKKRKVLSHYVEGEAPAEYIFKVEQYHRQFFIKQLIWLSTVFVIDFSRKTTMKLFRKLKYCI